MLVLNQPLSGSPGTLGWFNIMFTPNRLGGWSFGVQIPNEVEDVKTNTSKQRTLAKVMQFSFFIF